MGQPKGCRQADVVKNLKSIITTSQRLLSCDSENKK